MVAAAQPHISYSRQVSARRSTTNPEPLTRYTVACHIAKTVWQCLCRYGGQWTLRDGTVVRYEDLVLLELVQVSKGSHQIVLGYLEPRPILAKVAEIFTDLGGLWDDTTALSELGYIEESSVFVRSLCSEYFFSH